jgi:hypothetical protein
MQTTISNKVAPSVEVPRLALPACPRSFQNHRHAAAWMIRMGRALDQSNVPISPHISRRDNNDNFVLARKLIECGKRIAEKYGDASKESKLRDRLHAALAKQNTMTTDHIPWPTEAPTNTKLSNNWMSRLVRFILKSIAGIACIVAILWLAKCPGNLEWWRPVCIGLMLPVIKHLL